MVTTASILNSILLPNLFKKSHLRNHLHYWLLYPSLSSLPVLAVFKYLPYHAEIGKRKTDHRCAGH